MTTGTASRELPSRDVLKALGDNTRYAIYLELARSPRPLVTAEIADMLGLHPNTVRPHLERMREVGLLDVTTDARGEVGRPQHRYSLAPDAPSLGLEPPTMPMLARLVLEMAQHVGASPADAAAVGAAEGRVRAASYADAPSALEALVADLDRLGFDPLVADAAAELTQAPPTTRTPTPSRPSWHSPTARSPTSPGLIPISSAHSTVASCPGSSSRWAMPRSVNSARWSTARPARSPWSADSVVSATVQEERP